MKVNIKLKTGKRLNLTGEELKELLDFKNQEKIFCVVFHYWFQETNYWKVHYIKAENIKEARKEALLIKEETESTFNRCDFQILELFKEGSKEIK